MTFRCLAVALATAALPGLALAQSHHDHGSRHARPAMPGRAPDTAATTAFREANARMHRDMDMRFTGDPDADFVRGMIPHHQGAIDMARVVLRYGKDERTRRWAAEIIGTQEREIAEMQDWLRKRGF